MPDISQRIDCVTDECAAIIETIKRQQSEEAAYASTLPAEAYNSEAFLTMRWKKSFAPISCSSGMFRRSRRKGITLRLTSSKSRWL
ncbi:hypothetical protein SODG_001292 [Sodalis praecaptivus]